LTTPVVKSVKVVVRLQPPDLFQVIPGTLPSCAAVRNDAAESSNANAKLMKSAFFMNWCPFLRV
jgi:hypothetical protein